ncbi:MAG: hypothetical protein L0Y80_05790 [Ignavibacteriae bacterium]|nr:hypothetical protein [Ignavibacteriota bacterium]
MFTVPQRSQSLPSGVPQERQYFRISSLGVEHRVQSIVNLSLCVVRV